MHRIEVSYLNPHKPHGVVGGTPIVALHQPFSFFSQDGKLEVQFLGDSPVSGDLPPQKLADNTQFIASKPGRYRFRCFLNGNLLPDDGGGELEVPPPM